jgi:hypothetical protein
MSSSHELYNQVFAKLRPLHPTLLLKRLAVWVWVIVGLIQSRSIHLSEIANYIPDDTDAVSRIARIRRWLASRWVVSRTLYQPIIREVLQAWNGCEVTIILDGCFIRHKTLQILRVSLSHCYRALPLAWEVVTTKGNVELKVCTEMLDHVATLLARTRRVTFLADRGFHSHEWARKCRELNWN